MDNRLVIAGTVAQGPETRFSPGGVPLSRFTLSHHSEQVEAGAPRRVVCEVTVVAAGEALQAAVKRLQNGTRVRVHGFLGRADSRRDDRLVLHAHEIESTE